MDVRSLDLNAKFSNLENKSVITDGREEKSDDDVDNNKCYYVTYPGYMIDVYGRPIKKEEDSNEDGATTKDSLRNESEKRAIKQEDDDIAFVSLNVGNEVWNEERES